MRSNRIGIKILLAFLIPFGLATALLSIMPGPLAQTTDVVIPPHSNLLSTAKNLKNTKVITNEYLFAAWVFTTGNKNKIKAGEYEFTAQMSLWQVIQKLARGEILVRKITIPEGWTAKQIIEALNQNPFLTGTVAAFPAEGTLMPDTYTFTRGDARDAIIARMQKAMSDFIFQHWPARAPDYFLKSPEDWIKLASIVEAETPKQDERARIAGVYMNRLEKPMQLQADPTVIYGLDAGRGPLGRPLTLDDLKTPTAYNTYMNEGLPPTPINNPSRASLLAALKPEKHNYYFFVANGKGGHIFATTFEEHKQNRGNLSH